MDKSRSWVSLKKWSDNTTWHNYIFALIVAVGMVLAVVLVAGVNRLLLHRIRLMAGTSRSPILFQHQVDPETLKLRQSFQLLGQGQIKEALDKVNDVLQADPKNMAAYGLRGNIYVTEKLWDQAKKDYQIALANDPKDASIKFNLAQVDFLQKKFDAARPGFVALQQDPDMGDLATYKVFICDLFGGHEDTAAKELAAFNQVGTNPSYYFGNAAWSLYHQKVSDAGDWLRSAGYIYAPAKFRLYSASLKELGYPGRLDEHTPNIIAGKKQ